MLEKYIVTIKANEQFEKAIGTTIKATFDVQATGEKSATFRAETMMGFIMQGYADKHHLSQNLVDDGCEILSIVLEGKNNVENA